MPAEKKQYEIKEYVRKFLMGFQLISSLALGIFVIAVLYFALKYLDVPTYTPQQVLEAQKIGNWEFPDNDYVLKKFENISIENKNIGAVTVKDKKSGNVLMVFEASLTQPEMLKTKDDIQNKLLEKYDLRNFYLKSSGNRIGKIGEEFVYSAVGWNTKNGNKTGIIGSLDCLKDKKSGNSIIAFVTNNSAKYSEERALSFINTINCPAGGGNGGGDVEIDNKMDTDNDGLTDKVERMLLSDPYKRDTDGDGYDDFQELQSGYSPMIPRPYDKYTPEEFEKVKKDIKFVNIDVYDKLFLGN